MYLKSSRTVSNITPGFRTPPNIVCVFPAPVAPYANTVALKPLTTPSSNGFAVVLKTSLYLVSPEKAVSNA